MAYKRAAKVDVSGCLMVNSVPDGRLAQLGERQNRTLEAEGSTPLPSTLFYQ